MCVCVCVCVCVLVHMVLYQCVYGVHMFFYPNMRHACVCLCVCVCVRVRERVRVRVCVCEPWEISMLKRSKIFVYLCFPEMNTVSAWVC